MVLIDKDFEEIAKIFRLHLSICNEEQKGLINLIIDSFIPFLRSKNHRFSEAKFRNALNNLEGGEKDD